MSQFAPGKNTTGELRQSGVPVDAAAQTADRPDQLTVPLIAERFRIDTVVLERAIEALLYVYLRQPDESYLLTARKIADHLQIERAGLEAAFNVRCDEIQRDAGDPNPAMRAGDLRGINEKNPFLPPKPPEVLYEIGIFTRPGPASAAA